MQSRNYTLDLAKYVASLMVIAIHTGLLSDISESAYFLVVNVVCRLAVPFFAVCSGFFMGMHIQLGHSPEKLKNSFNYFLRQWKKQIQLYAVWSVVYMLYSIPRWINIGWFSLWAFVDYVIAACTKGSYYHLWYLWGITVALPLLYGILRWVPQKLWAIIAVALWLLKAYEYAYAPLLSAPFSKFFTMPAAMGTILCLLPLLILGASISCQNQKYSQWNAIGFFLSFILLTIEASVLNNRGQQAVSYILFTLPTAYFLFRCLLQSPAKAGRKGVAVLASLNMFIYCAHPMIVEITEPFIPNSVIHYLICAIGATALGVCYSFLCTKCVRKKVN